MTNRSPFLRRAAVALIALAALACPARSLAGDEPKPVTVIFARHAEKAAEPKEDPPLTDAGRARAAELARVMGPAGVTAVLTSQWARTRQTAEAVGSRLGVAPTVVALEVDQQTKRLTPKTLKALVDAILGHKGGAVLVVGHSNTIPEVIAALGGPAVEIDEKVFDDLFVVTVTGPGRASAVRLKYGPGQ